MSKADSLEILAEHMAAMNMRGQWQNDAGRQASGAWADDTWTPAPHGQACLWKAAPIHAFLERSAKVLPESLTSRRSILFNNPALPRGSLETINMGIQLILPGELAWAHRHSISALRFVIKGHRELLTVVDGIPCPMETGDLVLTPGGDWHDHSNGSDEPVLWLDVLDGPIIYGINQPVFQNYGERRQPIRGNGAQSAPSAARLRFPWAEVGPGLAALDDDDADRLIGHVFDYVDPATGAHSMRTLGCRMHRLPAGFAGKAHRSRANMAFHAFRGAGRCVVDGRALAWEEGDCFVVPAWSTRRFEAPAGEDAYLFAAHDEPFLERLGLLGDDLPGVLGEIENEAPPASDAAVCRPVALTHERT